MTDGVHSFLLALTDLGDSAVLAAVVVAAAGSLLMCGCRKGAVALVLAFVLAAMFVGGMKLALLGCGAYFRQFDIQSPSGHAALSSAVFTALAMLMGSQMTGWRRFIPIMVLSLLIAVIAGTRFALGCHSAGEVVLGLIAGSMSAALMRLFLCQGSPMPAFNVWALAVSTLLAIIMVHGTRLPAEALFRLLALQIKAYAHCA